MKKRVKRIFSGVLSALTILTSVVQPMTAYAGETNPKSYEMEYPALEQVKTQLQEDEIVTVQDYEVEKGSDFDIKTDFSGMKFHSDKVKVRFYEAKNQKGQEFHTDHADTYQAVYFVEPIREAPSYHVIRNITVTECKEKENLLPSKEHGKQEKNSEEEEASQKEEQILTEDEFSQALEESKKQDTYDEESGLGLYDVMVQAGEQEIDLFQMKEGETVTFVANASDQAARATQTVTITKGPLYRYQDYDLGTYVTEPYFISYGNVHATAYCIQPSLPGPGTGTYTITKIEDNQALAKVCYYGTEAAGKESYFAKHHSDFSEGKRFILTHIAAAYAYGSADAFYGANETAKSLAMEIYNYCVGKPEIPEVSMSFSNNHVKAFQEGQEQRTEDITFTADSLQSITMQLPKGVVFHNLTTGKNSAAGAKVTLSGGTKFYLSAPLTQTEDVEGSWTATMQGSITKDYSAYKLTTNDSVQDLAFVFGEGVEQEQYVEFSVEWLKNAKIELVKKDQGSQKKMEGAVYGVYRDEDCTDLIVEMPATDKKGASSVTIEKTQDTVYLKEISAPQGYVLDTKSYGVKLEVGKTVQIEVTDREQLASLTVYKEGEVLTGAEVTEEGVTFSYTKEKQEGAVYDVYAEKEIVRADGTVAYKKGAVVKKGLKTGEDGSVTLSELPLGTYKVVEVKAPENFVCKGEAQTVTLSYAGQNEEVVFETVTFVNDRQKASVSVRKEDKDTENPLAGGIYGLYTAEDVYGKSGKLLVEKDTLIEKVTTGENGTASYQADLPIGYTYYIKELQAPAQYVKNETEKFSFHFQYVEGEEQCSFSHTFQNERVKAEIVLEKEDAETGKTPQGDASLKGAVYGLYARENIVHPDGKTGVLYQKDEQVATLKTDDKGKAEVKDLYLGSYYIKEITPPAGYLLDETEHDVICDDEGDTVAIVKRVCNVKEQVKKQPFQLIKAGNNGNTDAELLKGAGFQAYLESSLKKKEDGSYDFASATPVVIGENGATELFTDERGYACSIPLPYGTYVVRETTTPPNYKPVKDFIVRITEHKPDTPQIWRVLLDKEFEAKLKIIKKDDESKKPVLKKGTEFKVYDLDRKKYVEQVTTYPTTVVHKSYFTDETGYLILPQNLDAGHYRIEEVTAPDGYTLNENYYEVSVASDTAYQMDSISGDVIIEVVYENHPVKGELQIVKKGEILEDFDKDFSYQEINLSGAVFDLYAAEDIYTADAQKDEQGNRILEYAEGTKVATLTTDQEGKASVSDLPLGTYELVEITSPEGFVKNPEPQKVTFKYEDQNTPVIEQEVLLKNERQKAKISVVKRDAETKKEIKGAVFGLYAKEDIQVGNQILVKADTLIGKAETGEDGKATFSFDLPFGKYYVKELEAPEGYVSSEQVLDVEFSYQGQEIDVVELTSEFLNQPTKVSITKVDTATGVELSGATLVVLDKNGEIVDSWKSVKGEAHVIRGLKVGETYTLREETAPYGYLREEEVSFTVKDTEEIQKVEMKDDVPTGSILINKKGEFLEKVSVFEQIGGWISHVFEYLSGSLKEVTFAVYAREDIPAADGESKDYYKKDELVAEITTDHTGVARISGLPLGKYYVKEKETAHGFVLDQEAREIDLLYRDQETAEITYSTDWQNKRQKAEVTVRKKEKDADRMLQGAVFALCVKEDIKNAQGNVIMKADTVIEEQATNAQGMLRFEVDLPVGYTYYIKETAPAPGFSMTGERKEFTFDPENSEEACVSYEFTFENVPTVVEFTKTSLTDGKEVEGAKLQVKDEQGKVIDEWVSAKEPHIIRELVAGHTYVLEETLPADGYVTAESISFTVEDTGEVQKVEMKDDITKVEISKTDISGKELPGAKLTILDQEGNEVESWTSGEKPHYIEMLPIGKYTLHEVSAPDGYLVAEDIIFEVKDTGEIQKVVMKDERKPSENVEQPQESKPTGNAPKTGDTSHVELWVLLSAMAVLLAGSSYYWIKKRKK
ncbi:MAG: SpaA isopeptide-forming pilin-related protein [Blautia producta]